MNPQRESGVTALDIAPEEIWMYIFDLMDTSDLVDVSLSCLSFSNFLRKKKVSFLFGKILPFIATSLDLSALLACRGVSKQWRAETDMFLESRSFTEMYGLDPKTRRKKNAARSLCPTLTFDMERMAEFQQSMKDHPTNPFVGRTVELELEEDDFGPVVRDTVQLFIETYGQHIWHFQYDDKSEPGENDEDIMTLDGAYERFKNISDSMPNLRSLDFSIYALRDADPDDENHEINPLIDLMAASPLPKLPFLEMLLLDIGDSFSDQEQELTLHCPIQCQKIYHNIFWAYGHQLKRLDIQWYYWNPYFPMENLTELGLHFFESNSSLEWMQNCMLSKRPSSTKPSLPSLLWLEIEFNYYNIDIDYFMSFLQKIIEICGRFEHLRFTLCIPPIGPLRHAIKLSSNIELTQMPDEYDSEVEWLRYMVAEFVNKVERKCEELA